MPLYGVEMIASQDWLPAYSPTFQSVCSPFPAMVRSRVTRALSKSLALSAYPVDGSVLERMTSYSNHLIGAAGVAS